MPGAAVNSGRIRALNQGQEGAGPVLYWMHREHRARDNHGLLHAQALAVERGRPLAVVWCLARNFPNAAQRHFAFLIQGLKEMVRDLEGLGIPFVLLEGDPAAEVPALARTLDAALVVTDFDSLRIKRRWLDQAARVLSCPLLEVDSHNVVPCLVASDKREYAARTIRPKVHRLLPEFLEEFSRLVPHPVAWTGSGPMATPADLDAALKRLNPDPSIPEVTWLVPGEDAAQARLRDFVDTRLSSYHNDRNDPAQDGQSGLSAYLHFGMLSAQRAALEAANKSLGDGREAFPEAFIEELVVRRELAENFCFHSPDYDQPSCFPDWALRTLDKHRRDPRPILYELDELEAARTQDPLWNAAQREMLTTGRMHGYLRMYWAKKILEWSPSPEDAMARAIRLNDRWFLDGRDPNGYTGVAWSIGGVHDRPWKERPIFGTIRYMNYAGAKRKFDIDAYARRVGMPD